MAVSGLVEVSDAAGVDVEAAGVDVDLFCREVPQG